MRWLCLLVTSLLLVAATACQTRAPQAPRPEVVIYASVDQVHAEPVLQRFEQKTGIHVLPVYDVEASKTTGMVERLIAEKDHARADVFWNGEFVQTLRLASLGVLAPYASPVAAKVPKGLKGTTWTAFGGRARILLVRTGSPMNPRSVLDLATLDPPAKVGIALPLFGTSATHAAALYAALGRDKARDFYTRLQARGVRVLDGNAAVREAVVGGRIDVGLTDSDDAVEALAAKAAVRVVVPDQDVPSTDDLTPPGAPAGKERVPLGALVVPQTVGLVAGGPHVEAGRKLVDFLLSEEAAGLLARSGFSQVGPGGPLSLQKVRRMNVSFEDMMRTLGPAQGDLRDTFVR